MKRLIKIMFTCALVMGIINIASAQDDDDAYYSSKDKKVKPTTSEASTIDASKATPAPAPMGNEAYEMGSNNTSVPAQTQQTTDGQGNTYVTNNYYDGNDSYAYRLHRYHGYYGSYYDYYDPWYYPSWSFSVGYGFGYGGWGLSYGYPYYGFYDPFYWHPYYYGYHPYYSGYYSGYYHGHYDGYYSNNGYGSRSYYGARNSVGGNSYGSSSSSTSGGSYYSRGNESMNIPRGATSNLPGSSVSGSTRGISNNVATPRDMNTSEPRNAGNGGLRNFDSPRNLNPTSASARVLEPRNVENLPANRNMNREVNAAPRDAGYSAPRGGYNNTPRYNNGSAPAHGVEQRQDRSSWNNSPRGYDSPRQQQAPTNYSPRYSSPSAPAYSAPRGGGYSAPASGGGGGGRSSGGSSGGGSRGGGGGGRR